MIIKQYCSNECQNSSQKSIYLMTIFYVWLICFNNFNLKMNSIYVRIIKYRIIKNKSSILGILAHNCKVQYNFVIMSYFNLYIFFLLNFIFTFVNFVPPGKAGHNSVLV